MLTFHVPTVPLTAEDLIDRRLRGRPACPELGEHMTVRFNGSEWIVAPFLDIRTHLTRGSLHHCLDFALAAYEQGGRGAAVVFKTSDKARLSVPEQVEMARAVGLLEGSEGEPNWVTDRHRMVLFALGFKDEEMAREALTYEGDFHSFAVKVTHRHRPVSV